MNRGSRVEPIDAHWKAQERALQGAPRDPGDAVLASALRTLPAVEPPPGFAAAVARVAAQTRTKPLADRSERRLLGALGGAMAAAAGVCTFVYGDAWTVTVESMLGGAALRLGLAGVACLAISAVPWRRALGLPGRSRMARSGLSPRWFRWPRTAARNRVPR